MNEKRALVNGFDKWIEFLYRRVPILNMLCIPRHDNVDVSKNAQLAQLLIVVLGV
jgi:hypothetical protein